MMLTSFSIPLLGIVDTALLGNLDSISYLGAVSIGSTFLGLVFWSLSFLRMGTTGMVAQAFGQNKQLQKDGAGTLNSHEGIDAILCRGLFFATLFGILIFILLPIYAFEIASLMQASDKLAPLAADYIKIRSFSAVPALIGYVITGWLVGIQRAKLALLLVAGTNCINIILDIFFIYYLQKGSNGAAWATCLAETIQLFIGIVLLQKYSNAFNLTMWLSWLKNNDTSKMLGMNSYLLLRTLMLMLVFNFFTAQGAALGDNVVSANAILIQFFLLAAFVLDGFSHAAEALCGEHYGAKNYSSFKINIYLCGLWILICSIIFCLVYLLFGQIILEIFSKSDSVLSTANQYLHWVSWLPVLGALAFLFDGVSIATSKTKGMFITMLFSSLLFFIVWYFMKSEGNIALWYAFTVWITSRSISLSLYWLSILRKLQTPVRLT